MKVICIADSHNYNISDRIPDGDILIHAGDATFNGRLDEIARFTDWFHALPHKIKIFVAGNHDILFETMSITAQELIMPLHDEEIVVEGIKIYGSSWQPESDGFAFEISNPELKRMWAKIPEDIDILITHTPPRGILDTDYDGEEVGCTELLYAVRFLQPKFHIFGKVHESYGCAKIEGTTFINASICGERYQLKNKPISFEI